MTFSDINSRRIRQFPFVAGTKFKETDWRQAEKSLKVFMVLWDGVKGGTLTVDDIRHSFFYSTSDTISYRESWKCGQYWSVAAWELACKQGNTKALISEHVLPREAMLQHLFSDHVSTANEAAAYLWENSFVCVITKEENKRLNKAKLAKEGFPLDPWKRYSGECLDDPILVLDAEFPPGNRLMSDVERVPLEQKNLLRGTEVVLVRSSCVGTSDASLEDASIKIERASYFAVDERRDDIEPQ
ncbi:hypothetical protein ABH945_002155 [Paraburkholderia sp. GAS333]|uniref:hypothetical protein n=1 Tax=Paraburkholderia sp. GAS333 TaxID=3156279 RepID=UPI003D23A2DA